MKIIFLLVIPTLIFATSCGLNSYLVEKKTRNSVISEYNSFFVPINYFIENNPHKGALLFVSYSDNEIPLHYTNVYLLKKNFLSIQLLSDTNALTNVYEFCISPDSKYLSVTIAMEGHPWIDIYDIQQLIDSNQAKIVTQINPYPGYISIVGWQKDRLIIKSDANLLLKNIDRDSTDYELSEKANVFYYDIQKNIFIQK